MIPKFRSSFQASYRLFQSQFVERLILPHFFTQARIERARIQRVRENLRVLSGHILDRVWFHAASVGELESLIPLIQQVIEQGSQIAVTILSESAQGSLEKLIHGLGARSNQVVFWGYSPWEGHWEEYLEKVQPSLFVTAKYEAWPDLWVSLAQLKIPLAIVSVHARKSLRIAKSLCQWMQGRLPDLLLFPCLESDLSELKELFPNAKIHPVGEPRWDRVYSRSQIGNSRAQALIGAAHSLPRPWGVMGSVWLEDLIYFDRHLTQLAGTIWVVPHRVDSESVKKIEEFLRSRSLSPLKTKGIDQFPSNSPPLTVVIVNEMGFLSELYSAADWAWVGGGWGDGIHSTIEPAIHGIPIGVGPNGTEKFTEVRELTQTGQLTVCTEDQDLKNWLAFLQAGKMDKKTQWKQDAQLRLGATQKILAALEKFN